MKLQLDIPINDILKGLTAKNLLLESLTDQLVDQSEKKAQAERDHSQALTKEVLKLKGDGIAVTIIKDVAKGNCAELKYKWDVEDGIYRAIQRRIDNTTTAIDSYRSLFSYRKEHMAKWGDTDT